VSGRAQSIGGLQGGGSRRLALLARTQAIEAADAAGVALDPLLDKGPGGLLDFRETTTPLASPQPPPHVPEQLAKLIGLRPRVALGTRSDWRPTLVRLDWGAEALRERSGPISATPSPCSSFSSPKPADWIAGSGNPAAISAGLPPGEPACAYESTCGIEPAPTLGWWRRPEPLELAALQAGGGRHHRRADAASWPLLQIALCWIQACSLLPKTPPAQPDGVRQAMRFGSACGALSARGPARSGAPAAARAEVETFLQQFSADSSGANPENPNYRRDQCMACPCCLHGNIPPSSPSRERLAQCRIVISTPAGATSDLALLSSWTKSNRVGEKQAMT